MTLRDFVGMKIKNRVDPNKLKEILEEYRAKRLEGKMDAGQVADILGIALDEAILFLQSEKVLSRKNVDSELIRVMIRKKNQEDLYNQYPKFGKLLINPENLIFKNEVYRKFKPSEKRFETLFGPFYIPALPSFSILSSFLHRQFPVMTALMIHDPLMVVFFLSILLFLELTSSTLEECPYSTEELAFKVIEKYMSTITNNS